MGRDRPDPNEAVQRRVRRHRLSAQGQRRRGAGAAKRQGRRADRVGARQKPWRGPGTTAAWRSARTSATAMSVRPRPPRSQARFIRCSCWCSASFPATTASPTPACLSARTTRAPTPRTSPPWTRCSTSRGRTDSVSWYSYNTGGAYAQLNTYGTTYLYIILGYDKATEDAE